MGTISNALGVYGLTATGTPAKTKVAGSLTIGVTQTPMTWADADIAYSFKVAVDDTSGCTATLDFEGSSVSAGTGNSTISDGNGNDFDGTDIPDLVTFYGILIEYSGTNGGGNPLAASSGSALGSLDFLLQAGGAASVFYSAGIALVASEQMVFTIPSGAAAGSAFTVTVLGKSS